MRLVLLCLGFCSLAACAGHHHDLRMPQPSHELTVSGSGDASAAPDVAFVNIGVEVRSTNVAEATRSANQRMAMVIAALKQAGIADKDLRTHDFAIGVEQEPVPMPAPAPQPAPQPESAPAKKAGHAAATAPIAPPPALPPAPVLRGVYRVSNMLEATIRDLNSVGRVLGAAVDAGANNVWGVSFELENNDALVAAARVKAVEHAKGDAEELARLTGVKLGKVISVSEGERSVEPGQPMFDLKAASSSVPIERGQVTVTQNVEIVYALSD